MRTPNAVMYPLPSSKLPVSTYLPLSSTAFDGASVRPMRFWSLVVSAVHQPETASWSLSRNDETRMPNVGAVQMMTISRTAR